MNKFKVPIIVLTIFLAGFFAGIVSARQYIKSKIIEISKADPNEAREIFLERLSYNLKLTSEQKPEVEELLKKHQNDLLELRKEFQPQVIQIVLSASKDLMPLLDDKQRMKLSSIRKELGVFPISPLN